MSAVGATRLISAIMNDLLKLIGTDYVFSVKSSNAFLPYLPSHGCQLNSHQPWSVGTFKEKCIQSDVWCLLLCLGGGVGEDDTVLHTQTTVVICQQSSEFENKFPSCKLEGGFGIQGHYQALKQNQALYLRFYKFIFSTLRHGVSFSQYIFSRMATCKQNIYLHLYTRIITFLTKSEKL